MSLAGLLLLSGCPASRQQPETSTGERNREESASAAATATDDNCLRVLDNVLVQLSPENMGQTAEVSSAVSLLNTWSRTCRDELSPLPEADQQALERLFTPEQREVILSDQYVDQDAVHVRNSALFYDIAQHIAADAEGGLPQAEAAFAFVCRNVQLVRPEDLPLPVPAFDVMMLGLGTAADRAWAFVETLRQLRIDCVLIRPQEQARPDQLLVGVCLEGDVYLFDPRLGLPLEAPAADETGEEDRVLTWDALAADPSLLDRYAGRDEAPHWLAGKDQKEVEPLIVGEPSLWAPRLGTLENILIGTRTMLLYEPIIGEEGLPGLLTRVAEGVAHVWPQERLAVWNYPAEQLRQYQSMSNEQSQGLTMLRNVLAAPVPFVSADPNTGQAIYGPPERTLRRARLEHLNGDYAAAVGRYSAIRVMARQLLSPAVVNMSRNQQEIVRIHQVALDDCLYWSGLCKFEQGEYSVAEDTFSDYQRRFPNGGRWSSPVRQRLAESLFRLGDATSAIEVLETTPETDPLADANAILMRKYRSTLED